MKLSCWTTENIETIDKLGNVRVSRKTAVDSWHIVSHQRNFLAEASNLFTFAVNSLTSKVKKVAKLA